MSDLIERLEDAEDGLNLESPTDLCGEAAVEIKRLEAELASCESDIANAVRQTKEVHDDYPWVDEKSSRASQAAWCANQRYIGSTQACDDMRDRLKALVVAARDAEDLIARNVYPVAPGRPDDHPVNILERLSKAIVVSGVPEKEEKTDEI